MIKIVISKTELTCFMISFLRDIDTKIYKQNQAHQLRNPKVTHTNLVIF